MAYKDSHLRRLDPKNEKQLQPKSDDEYLLLSKVRNSFDGRYIGTIKRKDIIYKAELFLEFWKKRLKIINNYGIIKVRKSGVPYQ